MTKQQLEAALLVAEKHATAVHRGLTKLDQNMRVEVDVRDIFDRISFIGPDPVATCPIFPGWCRAVRDDEPKTELPRVDLRVEDLTSTVDKLKRFVEAIRRAVPTLSNT